MGLHLYTFLKFFIGINYKVKSVFGSTTCFNFLLKFIFKNMMTIVVRTE